MKRKIAIILLTVTVLSSMLILSSCSKKSDVPSGMQLVAGGKSEGYYFYAPEEWTVSNVGEIKSAYASRVDTSSVSFCEIDAAKMAPVGINPADYFFNSYFESGLSEFPEGAKLEVTKSGEEALFGKEKEAADRAVKYTYNMEYTEHKFGFMQILLEKNGRFFVFTYCALLETRTDNKTYYDFYLEKVQSVIDEFRFVEADGGTDEKLEYKRDEDGYLLVTDKDYAGFEFYIPEVFGLDYASAVVSATHEDGSNINMSESMMTATMSIDAYLKYRHEELSEFVTELTIIPSPDAKEGQIAAPVKFGNADAAWSCEYTFIYNGEKYHVFQVYAVNRPPLSLNGEGFVFTYTAKEANYTLHSEEIDSIIEKVKFK